MAWVNYVQYEGEFKEGLYSGSGNKYERSLSLNVSLALLVPLPVVDEVTFDSVTSGEFRNGAENGDCDVYIGQYLWYTGEMKDGDLNGYGREYYLDSDVIECEGNYKDGMRNGKGTSYDMNGNETYKGEWRNDDYA